MSLETDGVWKAGVWDPSVWADGVWREGASPPILANAIVSTGNDTITLSFDRAVTFGAGGNGGFTLSLSGGACLMTYSSGDGSNALVYSLSRSVAATETGTMDYTQPGDGVEAVVGNADLASLSGFTVRIGSIYEHNDPLMLHNSLTMEHKEQDVEHRDPAFEHLQ